ncbi:hypothetical protein Kpol_1056p27 [Vanderwaltozyma polyspora DSM 70294]|uniref:SP-RING-type domain-containing protein n=1 Tax=Vanderwaltozyma polyspora (strain ATCC 22028 / DSM 70294 / BCRC 21397 / CBS 2163 / NBRC 10782 / NRRL Y-8283 / UCD 57-17) TaxID=436907 RepID=A7TLN4_VANPO|nr:uncharacterized protein Kpol_1056p27 [Vanderwaltozyma polyspora DSM 70294]EDO16826.1 hypothetical protein Kpol_1056p27 [Vanderwaltozyma polyspora DSM 70294]
MSIKLPDSVPLHRGLIREFHDIRVSDVSSSFVSCQKEIYDTLMFFLESGIDYEDLCPLVKSNCDTYIQLLEQEEESQGFQTKFKTIKENYKEMTESCEVFDLDTMDRYAERDITAPQLSKLLKEANDGYIPKIKISITMVDRILRAFPYIWKDPKCILPDSLLGDGFNNDANEDEIEMAGGSIELTCPITTLIYEEPMISKKCQHTFDKSGLTEYLKNSDTNRYMEKDCAKDGCSKKISMDDFSPDTIMSLRCKIYQIKRNENNNNMKLEALDVL